MTIQIDNDHRVMVVLKQAAQKGADLDIVVAVIAGAAYRSSTD
jgi:hypothetical protein